MGNILTKGYHTKCYLLLERQNDRLEQERKDRKEKKEKYKKMETHLKLLNNPSLGPKPLRNAKN